MNWPDGITLNPIGVWPGELTRNREPSKFDSTQTQTLKLLRKELEALKATDVTLQIALPPGAQWRLDGKPRADAKPEHPGVILTMKTKHGPLSYPCDTFPLWGDNLRAIALALEALRMVERYGVTKRGEQYKGSLAIEAGPTSQFASEDAAWQVIAKAAGFHGSQLLSEDSHALIRRAKFRTHPDTITVDNDPDDYARVVAAEQYLIKQGAIK